MRKILAGAQVLTPNGFEKHNIEIVDNKLFYVDAINNSAGDDTLTSIVDYSNKYIIPGLVDVHVHFREPGFFYKETIKSGTMAAAKGGYTTVCTMPNLKPAPVDYETLKIQLDIINKDAIINVIPYGAITSNQSGKGALSKMNDMSNFVSGFTDDGVGVQTNDLMREAMLEAKKLGKLIAAHCEDNSLNETPYTGTTRASESVQAKRDIQLAKDTGCKYHICHVSAKETIEAVRKGKIQNIDVTCETGPHYLVFNNATIKKECRFKMNPPIRMEEDRLELIKAIQDGTIDMIATDHAPHSYEEKAKGFEKSLFGVVGLETAFGILYENLVETKLISFEKLIELMAINPRKRFGIEGGYIVDGQLADIAVIDTEVEELVDSKTFISKGKSTPFDGMKMKGKVVATYVNGELVWS